MSHQIFVQSQKDATLLLDALNMRIVQNGLASVSDLNDLAGISSEYDDSSAGWRTKVEGKLIKNSAGYTLELTDPVTIAISDIETYIAMRDGFHRELVEIDKKIEDLVERREVLKQLFADEPVYISLEENGGGNEDPPLSHEDALIEYLENNPGRSRSDIERALLGIYGWEFFGDELSNLLKRARNHGRIKNEGTRNKPEYYAI